MFFLSKIIKDFGITRMEAIGCLCVKGMPADLTEYPSVKITEDQRSVLFQHYILLDAADKPILYNGNKLLGILKFYNKDRHYGSLISNTYQLIDEEFPFDGTDLYFADQENMLIPEKALYVFNVVKVKGFYVAVNIQKFDILEHKELAVNRVLNKNIVEHIGVAKINIFQISGLHCYDLLKTVLEEQLPRKETITKKLRIIQRAIGGWMAFFNSVESESNVFPEEYRIVREEFAFIDSSLQKELILEFKALCNLVPVNFLISFIVDYTERNLHFEMKLLSKKEQEKKAFEFLKFKQELKEKTVLQLSNELSRAYCEYYGNHSDNSYQHYEDTSNRDNWDAMTDGMYGDYPDEGNDGDFEFMGR